MTAPEPTAEHIDAVARAVNPTAFAYRWNTGVINEAQLAARRHARDLLTSTDPAVHAALAASLPAEVMLAALVDRGTLRSPETVDPIAWTIHVEVPTEATAAEVELLQERVATAAYDMERGQWDAVVYSHTLDCVASDHCAAPRPNGPPYPKPEVAP